MIKSMNGDAHIHVVSGTLPLFSCASSGAGMMRYNPTTCNVEVFDGYYWQTLSQHVTISIKPDTALVLEWGRKKMLEEQIAEQYAAKYPSVAAALEHRNQSQQTLDSVIELVKDY